VSYFKAKAFFTRSSPAGIIHGDPNHKDPRGRFLELSDAVAAPLLQAGLIEKTSRSAYHKGIEGQEVDGGDVIVAQVGGKRPPVSARWSNEALAHEAALRGVDASKHTKRGDLIKAINAKDTSSAPEEVDGTDNAFSRTGRESAESTRHSRRASPQNDVNASGTVDTEALAPATEEIADEEEAPTGGGASETK
jgi:hypothetical protein